MIKLNKIPDGGVESSTPSGHYLDFRGAQAQIITVGPYVGRAAYLEVMPGYRVTRVEIMESVADEGRFISVMLCRS